MAGLFSKTKKVAKLEPEPEPEKASVEVVEPVAVASPATLPQLDINDPAHGNLKYHELPTE